MTKLQRKIDYRIIANALDFYQDRGFKYIEVPWIVDSKSMNVTSPKNSKRFRTYLGELVASAEQSFISLILNNSIKPGKYVTCTPCFRDDKPDELHHTWFIKVELIHILNQNQIGEVENSEIKSYVQDIIETSEMFFNKYLKTKRLESSKDILDILSLDGIELGSYGFRKHLDYGWVFGTGVAEPRLSIALDKLKKGYHLDHIPRGKFGEISKIIEETLELKDALNQENNLMALMELSDIIGSIRGLLDNNYPGMKLDDLIIMSEATERAFKSGTRI